MTVVAAVARHGRVAMAADRETGYGNQRVFGVEKVWRMPAGPAGSAAGNGGIINVLSQHLKIEDAPRPGTDAEVLAWAGVVASAVTEILAGTEPPLIEDHDGGGKTIQGALLLGHAGRLFYLFTHQASPVLDGVATLGSGSEVALGALHTDLAHGASPRDAVTDAVELACRFSPGCGLGGAVPQVEEL